MRTDYLTNRPVLKYAIDHAFEATNKRLADQCKGIVIERAVLEYEEDCWHFVSVVQAHIKAVKKG